MTIDAKVANPFALGQRIFHEKFGYGSVVAIDADKLDIAFEKSRHEESGGPICGARPK